MPQILATVDGPQIFLNTALSATPSAGSVIQVPVGGDLQAALDAALPGDRIQLARTAMYTGNFILRAKSGGIAGGWITVEVDPAGGFLPEGTRVSPTDAATYNLPRIRTPNILPAIQTEGSNACKNYRFVGIEVDVDPSVTGSPNPQQGIVVLGSAGIDQNSLTLVPSGIYFDRCYVHGHDTLDCRKAFAFNAASLALVDSYVSQIQSIFDCQAVTGTNGPGPFKIVNNYLEASTENVAWGGGDPHITNLIPSDIEFRRNYVRKNPAWQGSGWLVKNLYESKNSRRALISGNVFENSWAAAQAGYAVVLWSVNQDGSAAWCETSHQTIQFNRFVNCNSGFQLSASAGGAQAAQPMNHIAINNNEWAGLSNANTGAGDFRAFTIQGGINQLYIEHNTGFCPSTTFIWDASAVLLDHIIRNNLTGGGSFQMFTSFGTGSVAWGLVAGSGSIFLGNVITAMVANQLAGNNYPATYNDIGLAGGGAIAEDVTATVDQLALSPLGPFSGSSTDGTDPGVDVAVLKASIAGVTTGTGGGSSQPVLSGLTLAPAVLNVTIGTPQTLAVSGVDQFGDPISVPAGLNLIASNPSLVSLHQSGSQITVTGLSVGTTQISVSSGSVTSNQVSAIIGAPPSSEVLASLVLGPNAITGQVGGAVETIQVGAFDAAGAPVAVPALTFFSTNAAVAQIVGLNGHTLTVAVYEAGIAHVYVVAGAVVSNRVTVLVTDPAGGKSHHRR